MTLRHEIADLPTVDDVPDPPEPGRRRARPFALDAKTELFFEKITQVAPTILYIFDLQAMENVWVNRSIFDYLGYSQAEIADMGPDMLADMMHEDDMARYGEHYERLIALGPTDTARFEYRMRHKDGGWRWLASEEMAYARDENDRVCQVVGSAHDITPAKEREERISLLMREMNHRVKNLFAVIGSMIALAGREKADTKTTLAKVRARINALALAHTISIGEAQDRDSALGDIVRLILTPYAEEHDVEVTGANPPLPWRCITPVGLIVHELATNAAKYGALRTNAAMVAGGGNGAADGDGAATDAPEASRVAISVTRDTDDVILVWREAVSPAPAPVDMSRQGFGAVLTTQAARQLGGDLRRRWREDETGGGVEVTLRFPV